MEEAKTPLPASTLAIYLSLPSIATFPFIKLLRLNKAFCDACYSRVLLPEWRCVDYLLNNPRSMTSSLSASLESHLTFRLASWQSIVKLHHFCTLEAIAFLQCSPVEHELHNVLVGWCGVHAVNDGFETLVGIDVSLDLRNDLLWGLSNWSWN
jgi:hypothetical protein